MADLDTASAEELERRFDPELQFRTIGKPALWISGIFLVCLSLFHYYIAGFGVIRELMLVGIHLSFVLGLVFLLFGMRRGRSSEPSWYAPAGVPLQDWVIAFAMPVIVMYLPLLPTQVVGMRVGNPSWVDVAVGTAMVVGILEATRRAMGWPLPLIASIFILYGLFGRWAPGVLAHPGADWSGLINHIYMTGQGVYGVAATVVARYVFLFVVFGVIATRIGLGQLFIDLASMVAGRYAGGPAKVAIFSSAMLGTISGSSIANTVTTGSLTIPAMKKVGYRPEFAGAVEATASTGGQITPPIMGAAAFIMAEFLEMPYRDIVIAAALPAAMHYLGAFMMVHLEAKKSGLRGLNSDEMPRMAAVLKTNWMCLFPLLLLIAMILTGRTPDNAAFWGITACIVVGFLKPNNRLTIPDLALAFRQGALHALGVGAAAACVGIIIGVVTLTGMGQRLSFMVTQIAADFAGTIAPLSMGLFTVQNATLFLTLLFTALACVIMGCGIPTTANYIIMVMVAAPTLTLMGIQPLATHIFVFYFGVLADITPPVALAAYAASSIARSNGFRTGTQAFRIALATVMMPFVVVYSPAMLIVVQGFSIHNLTVTLVGCIMGIMLLAPAIIGYMATHLHAVERIILGIAAVSLIAPTNTSTVVGACIAAPVVLRQAYIHVKKSQR